MLRSCLCHSASTPIHLPSGDQCTSQHGCPASSSSRGAPPCDGITYSANCPLASESTASCLPSGDQLTFGWCANVMLGVRSVCCPEPKSNTTIWKLSPPSKSSAYASCIPSGEYRGWNLPPGGVVMQRGLWVAVSVSSSSYSSHAPLPFHENATRPPSADSPNPFSLSTCGTRSSCSSVTVIRPLQAEQTLSSKSLPLRNPCGSVSSAKSACD
jgi:hypothetical protein